MSDIKQFIDFIAESPSAFHAVHTLCCELETAGFTRLAEHEAYHLVPGGKYYVTRNRSAVIAFTIPEDSFTHFQIVASHSDSPCFKLKHTAEEIAVGAFTRLNVERYGGMIMSTWLDRPLSIAGRVMVKSENGIRTELVDLDRDAALIPNMPIHFNREVNDGYKFNAQSDMLPLFGDATAKGALTAELAKLCKTEEENILACDLFLYPRTPGSVWGAKDEFFSAPRIDDLECAYTSLKAFLAAAPKSHINVFAVMDNEEVGSGSKQGADSTFLTDTLSRAAASLDVCESAFKAMLSSSFMVSADNAHAVHPNHPEKYDATNRCFMNGGVVIKHNANQKYTTDAVSCAIFETICKAAGVPTQHFANRSDILGGSTLGNIANAHASMNTVDIGLAQLAMHSSYETAGCADVAHMINALTAFYAADIKTTADGSYTLL